MVAMAEMAVTITYTEHCHCIYGSNGWDGCDYHLYRTLIVTVYMHMVAMAVIYSTVNDIKKWVEMFL